MEQLKETLLSFPHVQVVYLNEKGEWSFNERTGFAKSKTRLEILGDDQAILDQLAKEEVEAKEAEENKAKEGAEVSKKKLKD